MHSHSGSCLVIIFCSVILILVIGVASLVQTIHSILFCFQTEEREVLNEKKCFLKGQ